MQPARPLRTPLYTACLVAVLAVGGCGDSLLLPADPATLLIGGGGSGSGTVTGGTQPVLQCMIVGGSAGPSGCEGTYAAGTAVTLHATPANGSRFSGWSGPCSGTASCSVSLADTMQVVATFDPAIFTLSVVGAGTGTGTIRTGSGSVVPLSCTITAGATAASGCDAEYVLSATRVTLTATAASGSSFSGWGGECTGTGSCAVTLDQSRLVTAAFTKKR